MALNPNLLARLGWFVNFLVLFVMVSLAQCASRRAVQEGFWCVTRFVDVTCTCYTCHAHVQNVCLCVVCCVKFS
jgi:hypothetical protein